MNITLRTVFVECQAQHAMENLKCRMFLHMKWKRQKHCGTTPLRSVISVEFINTHLIWWSITQLYSDQSDDGWQTKLMA